MKHHTSIHCVLLSALLAPVGSAQTPDSLLSHRHCDHHKSTQWVAFGEIGDTAALISALREAADTDEAVTHVTVDYKEDGRIAAVHVSGARSHRAAKDLETKFRDHLSQLSALPKHFGITIARLNAMDYSDLLPGLVTCPPELRSTSKADSLFQQLPRLYQAGRVDLSGRRGLTALIGSWLEASGELRAIWIQKSSGSYALDQLALQVVQASRLLPPLVSARAAPALFYVPVRVQNYRTAFDTLRVR